MEKKAVAQPEGANDSVDESWEAADPRLLEVIQEKFLERPETPWQPLALKQVSISTIGLVGDFGEHCISLTIHCRPAPETFGLNI